MRDFILEQDDNRQKTIAITQSDIIYNVILAANIEKVINVPEGADLALFSSDGSFFCRFNATVILPTIDILDGSAGEFNPVARNIVNISTIHLISSDDVTMSISFYNLHKPISGYRLS